MRFSGSFGKRESRGFCGLHWSCVSVLISEGCVVESRDESGQGRVECIERTNLGVTTVLSRQKDCVAGFRVSVLCS